MNLSSKTGGYNYEEKVSDNVNSGTYRDNGS